MIYLSGAITRDIAAGICRHPNLGAILTPDMGNRLPENMMLAVDNGCFTKRQNYSDARYLRHLKRFPVACTIFATAPDVFGDHTATVAQAAMVLEMIRSTGLPAAFVAQDGWDESTTPWDDFDVLFIGGSTQFKFRGGRAAAHAAKMRGKKVHMGRVNSFERLRAAIGIGCDSADGTFLKYGPDKNWLRLLNWFDQIMIQPGMAI